MKKSHSESWRLGGKLLVSFLFLTVLSCNSLFDDEITIQEQNAASEERQWKSMLDQLIYKPDIIVQKNSSIGQAIQLAQSGDVIYVEPGVYHEVVTVDKPDITLIGLEDNEGNKVEVIDPKGTKNSLNIPTGINGVEVININGQNIAPKGKKSSRRARLSYDPGPGFRIIRDQLANNIAHYQFEAQVGREPHEKVRVHRVVQERSLFHPVRTKGDIFMIHGSTQDFDDIFYTAGAIGNVTPETSSPVYLASRGIDVWGIDLGWTMVPLETSDFSFMENWGVEMDADHTRSAMTIARLIRGMTGQGFGALNLLGFSYGATVAYAAAGHETQMFPILRNIKGLIPVDQPFKLDPKYKTDDINKEIFAKACGGALVAKDNLSKGEFQNANGVNSKFLGDQAALYPDEITPIEAFKPFTNAQVPIFLGAHLYLTGNAPLPFWHFVAGNVEKPTDLATDLVFTKTARWIALFRSLAPYQPVLTNYDVNACLCDEENVSFDDHLGEISVPIFYLGSGGGTGSFGEYTLTRTASTDKSSRIVSLKPDRFRDFGHADLFMAYNAPEEVWEPLYQWLIQHNRNNQ